MATNGTGVNEAIAVVLKAAKAVAGESWSENGSENGSERSEKKERKKETFLIEMQEKVKRKMIRLYQYDYGVKVHFRQHLVSFLGYLLHLVHIVYMLRQAVYLLHNQQCRM